MLGILFSLFLSHEMKLTFIHLTESTFKRQVLNRPKHQVWMVMFYRADDSACKHVTDKFLNASQIAEGALKFGIVDLHKYPSFAEKYDIKQVPMIRIFHSNGDVEYTGKRDSKGFVNTGLNYIQDISLVADESWIDSFLQTPSAIFFTDDVKIKSIWSSISTYFHGKSVRIGVCRDHDLAEKLGVTDFPSIHFFNGTNRVEYDGKISFPAIKDEIEKFFAKKLENIVVNPMSIMNPSSFTEQCYGGKTNCVLAVANQVTPEFVSIQKLYAQHKLKWFVGKSKLPHHFMEKMGGFWIYNPRKDAYIHVDKIGDLQPALDRIMDGMGKWQKAAAFENKEL
ncbi:hypothetical protein TVAG_305470 [Trichomonas vaginalis G3]|uniref:Thioredoxin domain-containing protein n=1 Tax=Trichomonas vaginalis (strain ATCC PRA-98 / G3) TaxID=412133 RepID=A2ERC1_TRIV3|nr:disulfide-isomerase A6 family [Trichomonas vaginalis G3]EAY04797.1 hypothetical protein TVAG_305470 [Trichomonas vaginalis G3]KAI5490998.1 disulfide-isomerase A6 family [Trichomonas vaginalis G3]|eukprot:XP_001317020.1 hypothetical protein [Trichomonas vaginalis G3]